MTRKEAMRQTHQIDTLVGLGFTYDEAETLRRISMTLRRWYERECNGDIQRDDMTEKPYCHYGHDERRYPVADREKGAEKRLKAIVTARNTRELGTVPLRWTEDEWKRQHLAYYLQTDPRGAALYIIRPGDVPAGADVSGYYSRGICVY